MSKIKTNLEKNKKYIGNKFNKLTIKKIVSITSNGSNRSGAICVCDCGEETKPILLRRILSGNTKSCGCLHKESTNKNLNVNERREEAFKLIGEKIGKLKILEITTLQFKSSTALVAICECDCGKTTKPIQIRELKRQKFPSCGCYILDEDFQKQNRRNEPMISSAREIFTARYADGDLSFEQFMILSQQPCFYCKKEPNNNFNKFKRSKSSKYSLDNGAFIYNGLDRINSEMPHNFDNIVPACKYCNRAKYDGSIEEFAIWLMGASEWAKHFLDIKKDTSSWIQTFTGKKLFPLSPNIEDITIRDIARALSNNCRFNGHCKDFYSVAQHSVLVSQFCESKNALQGLLHDASEAFLMDLVSPLKSSGKFESFRFYENQLQNTIYKKFNLEPIEPEDVKIADKRLLETELRDLMRLPSDYIHKFELFEQQIIPISSEKAELLFLHRFRELTDEEHYDKWMKE